MDDKELKLQVANQCRAIVHLCNDLSGLYADMAVVVLTGGMDGPLKSVTGPMSARIMEKLGGILNNIDAANEQTIEWTTPIFERAQELWPPKDRP